MNIDPNNAGYFLLALGVLLTIVAAWFVSREPIAKMASTKRLLVFVLAAALPISLRLALPDELNAALETACSTAPPTEPRATWPGFVLRAGAPLTRTIAP